MDIKTIDSNFLVSEQITQDDLDEIKAQGICSIICNRPDGEGADQPGHIEIKTKATDLGISFCYIPIERGIVQDDDVQKFKQFYDKLSKPILAYCRSGTRSTALWSLARASEIGINKILVMTSAAGFDMSSLSQRILNDGKIPFNNTSLEHDVAIVGAGAAGVSVCSSLLKRKPNLDVAIIDPSDIHYYQPGWTMVGGGIFKPQKTVKTMSSVIPKNAKWIKAAVAAFEPDKNIIILEGCRILKYKQLIICPGLKLNWAGIEGLQETLGQNGVTSNYRFDLAPYTWELIKTLTKGKALFTQPPMPIKCAGAPQKAMYLAADRWQRVGNKNNIEIKFLTAGPLLFSVKEYVPALMSYVKKYNIGLNFQHEMIKIDGIKKKAWFKRTIGNKVDTIEESFDMIHVCPPQKAPDFIRVSKLVNAEGWVDVDPNTLRHSQYSNIYALGDVTNTPNAKTAAAARAQAPVVAYNLLNSMENNQTLTNYNGYGSCPLTVENGKIIFAEFGYEGKLLPSFPKWFIDGEKPSSLAWWLKVKLLPPIYWKCMLKGREWLVNPENKK